MKSAAPLQEKTPGCDELFKRQCVEFSELLAEAGVQVRPFRSLDLPFFSKLDDDRKKRAVSELGFALEVYRETRAEGFEVKDSPKLIWRMLRKLGWTPQSDFFDKVDDDDVIQIYTRDQAAVFYNLNFFKWITYTIEDLYTRPWFELSRRDESAMMKLYEVAVEILSGVRMGTSLLDVPAHRCEEMDSEGMSKFWIQVKYASPVKKDGEVMGMLVTNTCWE